VVVKGAAAELAALSDPEPVMAQLTPALAESFATVAVKLCVAAPPRLTVLWLRVTPMAAGGGVELLELEVAPPQAARRGSRTVVQQIRVRR
jgi:hypothetical protein